MTGSELTSPPFSRQIYEPANPLLYSATAYAKRFVHLAFSFSLQARAYREDKSKNENPLRVRYIGTGETLPWLKKSLLDGMEITESGRANPFKWNGLVRACLSEEEVVLLDINRILLPLSPKSGFTSYSWIRQIIRFNSPEYRKRSPAIMAEFRRLMRKYEYTAGTTRDRKDTDYFYQELYLPFVEHKFGDSAHPRRLSEMYRAVKRGFILQIFHAGEWIAGDLVRIVGNELQGMASGLLPDYDAPSRRTARTVMYPILFEWAASRGLKTINLLRSRANLVDGVFASKKHRGAVAEVDCWPHTALRIYVPGDMALPTIWNSQLVNINGMLVYLEEARAKMTLT